MKIQKVLVSEGMGGFYFDDFYAIKDGREMDGFFYLGKPITPGHKRVRNKGETISIILLLEDGQIAIGDCVAIQYSGVVNRDPVLLAGKYAPFIRDRVSALFEGKEVTTFREMSKELENILIDGERMHTGIRYGFSQAILDAVAKKKKKLPAEIVSEEYSTEIRSTPVPVLAQSSDERYINADKMIIKSIPVIPQGLFNHVSKIGEKGEKLFEYVKWLKNRVEKFGEPGYMPDFHLDVYGTIGDIFNNNIEDIVQYLSKLEKAAYPHPLNFEDPIDLRKREGLIEKGAELVQSLRKAGSSVEITADEWCNTFEDVREFVDAKAAHMIQVKAPDLGAITNSVEAVLYCKRNGVKAFLGGTCNGTDISSRMTVQMALATNADLIYNKPGMGVDEGYMIVFNEMSRTLEIMKSRKKSEK